MNIDTLKRRLSNIEKSSSADLARWYRPDSEGKIPDNFNPETDKLILRSIVQPDQSTKPMHSELAWKGKKYPHDAFDMV